MFFLINGVNELTHLKNFILIISNNLYEREKCQKIFLLSSGKLVNLLMRDAGCHDWKL